MPPGAEARVSPARAHESRGSPNKPDFEVEQEDLESAAETTRPGSENGAPDKTDGSEISGVMEPGGSLLCLQVDDSPDNSSSGYAPNHYPDVPLAHRVEHPFDSATVNSSSRSIYEDELDYVEENGRRYCGDFYMPNDELEQDRLHILHQVFLNVFDLQLTTVPLENPRLILDIGTGTGEWAIGVAEQFPDCEVIGTDISAIQERAVPPNVFFEIDDAEEEWTRAPDSIDLVHVRNMSGAFTDWPALYRQALDSLRPGGWIELMDFCDVGGLGSFYTCFQPGTEAHEMLKGMEEAAKLYGRRRGSSHLERQVLIDAGFVDIRRNEYDMPIVSAHEKRLGKLWLLVCMIGVEAMSLRLMTRYMGWSPERVRAACTDICNDMKAIFFGPSGRERELNVRLIVVVARKPLVPGQWSAQNMSENGHMAEYSGDESTIGESTIGESTIGEST